MKSKMKLEYWFEMPKKWTFFQPKLLKFISKYIPKNSKILIPFAGMFRFGNIDNSTYIYNDINPEIKADHNINAYNLCWLYPKESFDCIIADPPFSMFQFFKLYNKWKNKYKVRKMPFVADYIKWRKTANYLLKPGGIYIELGFNSLGLLKKYAEKIALGVCCLGGGHNDILILVQKKHNNLDKFMK